MCPFRYLATVYGFIILCALLNFKLAYKFALIFNIEMFLLNNVASLILIDLYALSYAYHIAIYISIKHYFYNSMKNDSLKQISLKLLGKFGIFILVMSI